jgi:hypothetical protein
MQSDQSGSTHGLVQWTIDRLSDDTYTIQNFDYNSYANTEGGFWTNQGRNIG